MSIKIGIFDFFSYTIPGTLYLGLLWYTDQVFLNGQHTSCLSRFTDNIIFISILLVLSYLTGLLLNRIVYSVWWKPFSKNLNELAFKNLTIKYETVRVLIKLNPSHYYLYRVCVSLGNNELSEKIDRYDALAVLLMNTSFVLFLFSMANLIFFLLCGLKIESLFSTLIILLTSFLAIIEAKRQRTWALKLVYNYMITQKYILNRNIKKA